MKFLFQNFKISKLIKILLNCIRGFVDNIIVFVTPFADMSFLIAFTEKFLFSLSFFPVE